MNRLIRRAGLLSCLLASCSVSAGSPAPPSGSASPAAERGFYSANGLLNRGLYELAEAEYREFLRDNPDHELTNVAQYGLGVCLYRLGRHPDAIETMQSLRSVRDFEFAAEVATIIGQCHLASHDYPAAAKSLAWVIEEREGHELADDAAALLAESYYYDKQYDEVERTGSLFLKRWSESPLRERVELFHGLADMARERYEAGVQRFAALQRRYPSGEYADQVTLLLAQCLHHANSLERASEQYRNVIRSQNEAYVPEALHGLAVLHHQQKELDRAGELLDELLERSPEHELASSARLLRGRVWFEQGEFVEAAEVFRNLVEGESEIADAGAYWWAKCELRQEKAAEAAVRLAGALDTWPQSEWAAEMTYDLAVAQTRAGEREQALETLQRFRQQYGEHSLMPEAIHLAAITRHQLEQYDESLALCREFIREYGEHPLASSLEFLAAENSFLARDFEKAAAAYEVFLDKHPEDAQTTAAQLREGMSYYYMQRYGDAQPLLKIVARGAETQKPYRPALLALGDIAFQQGKWAAAEQFLTDYLSFGPQQTAADDALLKLGLAVQRQGRYEKAVEAFDGLLKFFAESAHSQQTLFERGQALVGLGRFDEAKESFEQTLKSGDDSRFDLHALNHLGVIAVRQTKFDEAVDFFARASEAAATDDERCEAKFQQGQALVSAQRFDEAVSAFESMLESCPGGGRAATAQAQRAISIARSDKPEEALTAIGEVESGRFPELDGAMRAAVLYEKAWSHRSLDRDDAAREAYQALLAEPGDIDLKRYARLELAELVYAADQPEEAAFLLRELLGSDLRSTESALELHEAAIYRLGASEFAQENYKDAAAALATCLDMYPESELTPSASLLCGEALIKLGSHEKAIAHLTRVVEQHADDDAFPTALLRMGEANASLQFWPRSEEAFSQYLERFYDADLWYQAQFGIGWARENQDQYDEAIAAYRPVVERHQGPTAARTQFQIGECLYAQEKFEEAVREFLKVDILYDYPEWNAAALFEAGKCFESMHNPVEARKQYQQVQETYGESEWAKLAAERLSALAKPSLPGH